MVSPNENIKPQINADERKSPIRQILTDPCVSASSAQSVFYHHPSGLYAPSRSATQEASDLITLRSLRALRCLILFTAEDAKVAKIRSKRLVFSYDSAGGA